MQKHSFEKHPAPSGRLVDRPLKVGDRIFYQSLVDYWDHWHVAYYVVIEVWTNCTEWDCHVTDKHRYGPAAPHCHFRFMACGPKPPNAEDYGNNGVDEYGRPIESLTHGIYDREYMFYDGPLFKEIPLDKLKTYRSNDDDDEEDEEPGLMVNLAENTIGIPYQLTLF